jgi:HK97 family phage portal protein
MAKEVRKRLLGAAATLLLGEGRSSLENPQTPLSFPAEWLLDLFNGGRTDSGIRVSEMTALQVSTVLTCVNIISGGLAALPVHVMERLVQDKRIDKRVAVNHSLYDVLHTEPNAEMSAFTLKKTLQAHALLWGNAYAEIERNNAGQIIGLWPRNPARTRPVRTTEAVTLAGDLLPAGTVVYETSDYMKSGRVQDIDNPNDKLGNRRVILSEDMVHIVGLSLDGRLGQSTVYLARQVFGLALAAEKYGAKWFGNGAVPAGIITLAGKLEDKALENLRRSWQEAYGGENRWKTAIMEQGTTFTKIGSTPNEGQFLETRKAQRVEIASLFQVPPHMIGEVEKTKSSVEQSSIEFVLYTLGPWIAAWENELKRKLFHTVGRSAGKHFAKFETRRLLYPDATSRSEFYKTGKNWGYLNSNDIREIEDLNPIDHPSADAYWMPLNMGPADSIMEVPAPEPGAAPKPGEQKPSEEKPPVKPEVTPPATPEQKSLDRQVVCYTPIIRDACVRFFNRRNYNFENCRRIFLPVLEAMSEAISGKGPDGKIIVYLEALSQRAANWTEEKLDEIASQETHKAIMELMGLYIPDRPLYAMRHGTTDFNETDQYREWTEVDLDGKGRAMVEQAVALLKDKGIKRLIATPLQRGKTTAEIASRGLGGVAVEYEADLNTWKHGFGGKTKAEAADKVKYYIEHPDEIPPNGESLNAFRERNQRVIDRIQEQNPLAGPTLFVTSGSNIGSWNTSADSVEKALSAQAAIGPGGIGELKSDGSIAVVFAGDQTLPHKLAS